MLKVSQQTFDVDAGDPYIRRKTPPIISVADPDPFDTDPDSAFHFNTDPDPAFQSDTDPDI